MKSVVGVLALVGALVLLRPGTAWAQPPACPTPVGSVSESQLRSLGQSDNEFGLRLFRYLAARKATENVFISPLSAALALHMTYNGAVGATASAMSKTLAFSGVSRSALNDRNRALLSSLKSVDPRIAMSIADELWSDEKRVTLQRDFVTRVERSYCAHVDSANFADPKTVNIINGFVYKATRGKIPTIIDSIPGNVALILLNALYFKGPWLHPFTPSQTATKQFIRGDGSTSNVAMMTLSREFDYLQTPAFQAVRLPYVGNRITMYVFLPAPGASLAQFERTLSAATWRGWIGQFAQRRGTLSMPRLTLRYGESLKSALKALGMVRAFDPSAAQLYDMYVRRGAFNAFVGEVRQKTYLHVDEAGSEAAAVTAVEIGITAMRPGAPPFVMTVDRPYFLAIADDRTGVLLFAGGINRP